MSRKLSYINILILSIFLTACGSDGSSKKKKSSAAPIETYSISGTFTTDTYVDVDSDVNNPESNANITNNDFTNAQPINNYFVVSGFASAVRTNQIGDRFKNSTDDSDVYQVNLEAGQTIRLQVANSNIDTRNEFGFYGDLDLILFNSSYEELSRSELDSEFESLTVPAQNNGDETYYIQVLAFNGTSKYVLSLEPAPVSSPSSILSHANFRTNEAIIKFKAPQSSSKTSSIGALSEKESFSISTAQKTHNNRSLALSHTSYTRPMLAKFGSSSGVKAQSTNKLNAPEISDFHKELQSLNPESYERYITLNTIKEFRVRDDVEYAQPNYIRTIQQVPNDSLYSEQWHYDTIKLPQAWDLTTGTPDVGSVIVAVIDTGVFLEHEDLKDKLVPGYDFISDPFNQGDEADGELGIDPNPDDPGDGFDKGTSSWHGTHVAGTIAAETNNSLGVAGVSWGAKIMPLRVLGPLDGTDYDIGQAALFAAGLSNDSNTVPAQKADIINMSLGGPANYTFEEESYIQGIFSRVRAEGVIIVAAAGNDDSSQPAYPAALEGIISVAATDAINNKASYSNFGPTIDIAAPGGDTEPGGIFGQDLNYDGIRDSVLSTFVTDINDFRQKDYEFLNGTSMAAPHVAGVIALMRAVYPGLSPDELDAVLASGDITSDLGTSGRDDTFGYGLIDAFKAVSEARRLENGGVVPELPPLVLASPASLNLGSRTSESFIISNSGGGTPIITSSPSVSNDWLSVEATDVDPITRLGTYEVTIDRTGLPNSSNIGAITFSVNTGTTNTTVEVPVFMFVGTDLEIGNIGTQFVLLHDTNLGETVDHLVLNNVNNGTYAYQFNNVAPGTYQILAGSDLDNDMSICQFGESCGEYPETGNPSDIVVVDSDISNRNFVSGILSNFSPLGISATSKKAVKLKENSASETASPIMISRALKE